MERTLTHNQILWGYLIAIGVALGLFAWPLLVVSQVSAARAAVGPAYPGPGSQAGLGRPPASSVDRPAPETQPDVAVPGATGAWWAAVRAHLDRQAGSPAWTVTGEDVSNLLGRSVASAGDVNGDGYADVLVGAEGYSSDRGRVTVFHGSSTGLGATPVLTLTGEAAGDLFGGSLAGAGDVNGDGYADVLVGAGGYSSHRGRVYVFHGSSAGLGATPVLTLTGEAAGDLFGGSLAGAGDVNGDGYADVLVGVEGYSSDQGRVTVYHGSSVGLGATPVLTLTGQGTERLGCSVAGAGDVNGDGYADAVVGAWGYPPGHNYGRAYVYHGSGVGLGATPALTLTGETTDDVKLGSSVAGAGDVNGDGYADVLVGAEGYSSDRGRVTVFHGSNTGLGATPVLTLTGEAAGDLFGGSLAGAGDVNGDGYADLLVGASHYNTGQGRAYVYHGSGVGVEATPALTLTGESDGDQFGYSVAGAGDVNGDGYADLLVGAPDYDSDRLGRVTAYHGRGAGLGIPPALTLTGEATNRLGSSVADLGDVNGDGYADLLVGAEGYDGNRGRATVYHGSSAGPGATPALTLTGEAAGDLFGGSVAGAGDVNGDGYADAVVGAVGYGGYRGRVTVYHGSTVGLGTTPALTLTGGAAGDLFGGSVAGVGDVNGDGYADVVVGARGYPGASYRGRIYVYCGSSAGLGATPALSLTGESGGDRFGYSMAGAGDVNGDGYADLLVGAVGYDSHRGRATVYHGSGVGVEATPALTLTGENTTDFFGSSVAGAGDVNGDGYADVLAGAYGYNGQQGRAYVYHGSSAGVGATPALSLTGESGGDQFGYSVAGAGDVDGDGYADLLVGAHGYNSQQGRAYVYHGSGAGLGATPALSLTGESGGDRFGFSLAGAGDVDGDGYGDTVVGAYGHASFQGRATVYHGNDGGGRAVLAHQQRGDGSGTPVQPWGLSYAGEGFQVRLWATDPRGRGRVKLQVEACPPGAAFGTGGCAAQVTAAWTGVTTATGGTVLTQVVTGLSTDTLYRWRARVLYAHQTVTAAGITPPPNPAHGPWRRWLGQAVEADLRTATPAVAVAVTVVPTTASPGQVVTYTYRVTNTGSATLNPVVAVDDVLGPVPLGTTSLAPDEWTTGVLTYTVVQGNLPGPITNTVTVTATPALGAALVVTDSAGVALSSHPAITVTKTVTPAVASPGQMVTYTYRVTNTGDVSLSAILAVDDVLGPVPLGTTGLAPDGWTTGVLTYAVVEADLPGPITNTVTVTGTPLLGAEVSARDLISVALTEAWHTVYLPLVATSSDYSGTGLYRREQPSPTPWRWR